MSNCCLGFDPSDKEYSYLGHFRQETILRAGHNTTDGEQYDQTAEQYGGAAQAPGTTSPFGLASALGNPL